MTYEKHSKPESIKKARIQKEKPVLDAFWTWLDRQTTVKGSRMEKAVVYARNRKQFLETYLEDGRCSFTNNASERSVKAYVTGRRTGCSPIHRREQSPARRYTLSWKQPKQME